MWRRYINIYLLSACACVCVCEFVCVRVYLFKYNCVHLNMMIIIIFVIFALLISPQILNMSKHTTRLHICIYVNMCVCVCECACKYICLAESNITGYTHSSPLFTSSVAFEYWL